MAVAAIPLGPLQIRASRIKSNGGLYDFVQDLAEVVDTFPTRFSEIDSKLDTILEKLNARD